MLDFLKYSEEFIKGYKYFLYESNENNRIEPVLDKSDMKSIGYYNGYSYGEYCEMTCQTMSIGKEQLTAQIDKTHTKALNMHKEYMDLYVRYKTGFIDGKSEFLFKLKEDEETLDTLPSCDENDLVSIGYYDGYAYFFEKCSRGIVEVEKLENIDEITKTCFREREKNLNEEARKTR